MNNIAQQGPVTTITYNVTGGWEKWLLLQSDNHHDSIKCNRELEFEHLEEAKRRDADIIIGGDLFDAMQGRLDPRRSMDELRPEYRRDDYYDFVVKDVTKFLRPYAQNIALITDGNHEMAVLKNANTNLSDRLVHNLRQAGSPVVHGGYGGWVRLMFKRVDGKPFGKGSLKIKYYHGAGGEAPVTRGVIQTNRQAVYLPDADIVVNGHNHSAYYVPITRERIGNKGALFMDIQHHIRIPGYKQDYGDGTQGWDVTRGGVPKPIGAFWVRLWAHGQDRDICVQVVPDIRAAVPVSYGVTDMYDGAVYEQDSAYP